MDSGTKNRFGVWAIIILLILNTGSLGLLWHEHIKVSPSSERQVRPDPEEFFVRELHLDQSQTEALRTIRRDHFRRTDSIRIDISRLKKHMWDELFSSTPDTSLVRQLSERIGAMQAAFEMELYRHFDEVKQLCSPDRHETLRQLMFEALEARRPPPRGPGRDPHPPHPDGRGDRPPPPPDDRRPPPPEDDRRPPGP